MKEQGGEMNISKKLILILCFVGFFLLAAKVFAVPACPKQFEIRQPDGSVFLARAFGDEWYNGMETAEGYTIFKEPSTGYWVYALKGSSGELYPSTLIVGIDAPSGIPKHIRDEIAIQRANSLRPYPDYIKGQPVTGNLRVLVILVEFKNRKLVGTNASDWKKRVFGSGNSVKDFYEETSYDQFHIIPAEEKQGIKNDGVVKVKVGMKHPNTGGSTGDQNRKVTKEALKKADKHVNYAKFDLDKNGGISANECVFAIVCAGYETSYGGSANAKQPNVWGHRWSLWGSVAAPTLDGVKVASSSFGGGYTQIGEWHAYYWQSPISIQAGGHQATIGIFCHELGHDAGNLPDLYDTDGSSDGIGKWGLMGAGSWNNVSNSGDSPAHPMGWCKYFMGWITPKVWNKGSKKFPLNQIETAKKKSLYLVGKNPGGAEYGGEGEYFLLENRQKVGYDKGLPGFGLLIWHIDESKSNNKEEAGTKSKHRLVDLEEADGKNDLDSVGARGDPGDPFPGSTNNKTFSKKTNPNSKFCNNKDSKVKVSNISNSKKKMTAKISGKG